MLVSTALVPISQKPINIDSNERNKLLTYLLINRNFFKSKIVYFSSYPPFTILDLVVNQKVKDHRVDRKTELKKAVDAAETQILGD